MAEEPQLLAVKQGQLLEPAACGDYQEAYNEADIEGEACYFASPPGEPCVPPPVFCAVAWLSAVSHH